jgi:hypothetical protein
MNGLYLPPWRRVEIAYEYASNETAMNVDPFLCYIKPVMVA